MFDKKDFSPIYAPVSGKVIALSDLVDPIFAGKVVGDGVAIVPGEGEFVSPISGVVSFVADTGHSFGITGFDGVEVLVHIGINTVKLNGQCFHPLVKKGDVLEAGQPLCTADMADIIKKGFDTTTPVVITSNTIESVKRLVLRTGFCQAGKSVCMKYIQDKK